MLGCGLTACREKRRKECIEIVCGAGWGCTVSSSLTSAREMLEWDRRYARRRVTSSSAAPCKKAEPSPTDTAAFYILNSFCSEVEPWRLRGGLGAVILYFVLYLNIQMWRRNEKMHNTPLQCCRLVSSFKMCLVRSSRNPVCSNKAIVPHRHRHTHNHGDE